MNNKRILQIGLISAIALVTIFVFSLLTDDTRGFQRVDTSVAMTQLQENNAREVQIDDRHARSRRRGRPGRRSRPSTRGTGWRA